MTQPKDESLTEVWDRVSPPSDPAKRGRRAGALVGIALGVVLAVTGCESSQPQPPNGPPLEQWVWTETAYVMTVCVGRDRLYGLQPAGSITVVPNGCAG